jgi:hypothetical protein
MIEFEKAIEDVIGGESDVNFLGHVTHPLWKVVSIAVPFIVCGVYLFERKCFPSIYPGVATTNSLTLFTVFGLLVLLVDLDFRKDYRASYFVRALLLLCICSIPFFVKVGVVSPEKLKDILLKVPVLTPFKWLGITFSDVVIFLIAAVGARASFRLHAMDAVWFSRFFVHKSFVSFYWAIIVTYLVCRKYLVNGVRDAWQASKAVKRRVRVKNGILRASIAQLEIFSLRLVNQFSDHANLVVALLGNVGIMDARYSSSAKYKFATEDWVYPFLLIAIVAFICISFGIA